MKKKACVIGAGPSGLVTIKELINKNIEVKCFESEDSFGGAFRSIKKGGRSYDSLMLTVSNYFMAYSDFMPKGEDRKYWSVSDYREYLSKYVNLFDLKKYIYLSHEVISADIEEDKVVVNYKKEGETHEEYFDYIVICSGSNFIPKSPEFVNDSLFEGEIIHSSSYVNANEFKGKDVVCIGLGESGADVVHEIGEKANSCKVLVRDYPNVIPRWINGHTNDSYTSHSLYALKKEGIDRYMKLKSWYYIKFNTKLSDSDRLIQKWVSDRKSFMGKFFTKSDVFIKDIIDGRIQLSKDSIESFFKNGIYTEKGEEIKADVILLNTGYKTSFEKFTFGKYFENPRNLFKHMLHPDYGKRVSLIGWARPSQGGLPACSEMQARYLALLLSEEKELPAYEDLKQTTINDTKYYETLFNESLQIKSLVCYNNFMQSMGDLIGCSPKLFHPNNLRLTKKMIFGSHISSFYRLPSNEAKEVIESLPTAYSLRRSLLILILIFRFNPNFFIKLTISKSE